MTLLSSLTRDQKQATVLLQMGTFLEYFDLMLYIHMAVILNELFFPQDNPHTVTLLGSLAFCVTFVFRPIGALVFGWIGDRLGRKKTIIMTTAMMAVSCLAMANLPTYAQWGLAASWIMIICRVAQGMSCMGEICGALVYLTEMVRRPARYPVVSSLNIAAELGGFGALGIIVLVNTFGFNWRWAFWGGALIAIVGYFARKRLRETPEFLEAQRQWLKKGIEEMNLETDPVEGAKLNATWKEPIEYKPLVACFSIACGWPVCFYLAFIYFNPVLQSKFGYSPEDIVHHNFLLSIISVISSVLLTYLSSFIHPLKILKTIGTYMVFVMVLLPFLVTNVENPLPIFLAQGLLLLLPLSGPPADAVFISHFPIYRRVTLVGLLYASCRAFMFVVTSVGLIYLERYFGHYGIWVISLPVVVAYLYGVQHFIKLERHRRIYPDLVRNTNLAYGTP